MDNKEFSFITDGKEYKLEELGDMYGDRQAFNEKLAELNNLKDFNEELEWLQITIKRIPK